MNEESKTLIKKFSSTLVISLLINFLVFSIDLSSFWEVRFYKKVMEEI